MEEEKYIKKAYKCGTCALYDYENKRCTFTPPYYVEFELDDLGNPICRYHSSKKTKALTGGFYYEMKKRQKVFFIGDLHFGHLNIINHHPQRATEAGISFADFKENPKECNEKHDKWLIELWNKTVSKEDTVYILGDFCLKNKEYAENILKQLKGKKFFINGNHDKAIKGLENYFEWVGDIKEVKFTNNQFKFISPDETFCIELCHYPMLTWNRRPHGSCMVHGHCHGSIDKCNEDMNELRVDVGLDGKLSNYHFIELEELYNYFCKIRDNYGCKTFQEFIDKRMKELGYRA